MTTSSCCASTGTNAESNESEPGPSLASPGLAWGLQRVAADKVWAALSITGKGVVVANLDTGVDFLHQTLAGNYRGSLGKGVFEHEGNWFDAVSGTGCPCDAHGHGTHTMGIMAGQDGIGVAPGARWIAVRVLDNAGYGYNSWIHADFPWVLAPGGDPARAPQVLNNSWGSDIGNSEEFRDDAARLRQAGIFAVFSAGNGGPGAGTLTSPASLPAAFAVVATDGDDEVAVFPRADHHPGARPSLIWRHPALTYRHLLRAAHRQS